MTTPHRPCIFAFTLKIELLQSMLEPCSKTLTWKIDSNNSLTKELKLIGELKAELLFSPNGKNKYLLTGSVSGVQVLTCVRSLDSFERPFMVDLNIEAELSQSVSQQTLDDEDDEIFKILLPVNQSELDVAECVRQLVLLQEPLSPIKNPNEDFVFSDKEEDSNTIDPRWEQLKALRRKMENKNRSS